MGNCSGCKHWDTTEHVYAECAQRDGRGVCRKVTDSHDDNELAEATCWSEGIGGELITAPEFGCVLFEKKP